MVKTGCEVLAGKDVRAAGGMNLDVALVCPQSVKFTYRFFQNKRKDSLVLPSSNIMDPAALSEE